MDWWRLVEILVPVVIGGLLGAGISFRAQMLTIKNQGEMLEKQLRADRESQRRGKQLHALPEVSALLEVAFRQADNQAVAMLSADPQPDSIGEYQLAGDLARHMVPLPKALRKAARDSAHATDDYRTAILLLARDTGLGSKVAQEPHKRVALVLEFAWQAAEHDTVKQFKDSAQASLSSFQWAANHFSNEAGPSTEPG